MHPFRIFAGFVGVAAVGVGAFFGVRFAISLFSAEAQEEPTRVVIPAMKAIEDEKLEPRFEGEVGGVYIARAEDTVPSQYQTIQDVCPPDSTSVDAPFEEAGHLNIEVSLPPAYVLQADDPNTGAIECNGVITTARRHYLFKASTGATADVFIGRGLGNVFCCWDVAQRRVKVAEFGGHSAAIIEPVTDDGVLQQSGVVFLNDGFHTSIRASSLPLKDLREIAEIVGQAWQ